MPQFLFPHNPKAIGVEVALIAYFIGQPGNLPMIGTLSVSNAPMVHAAAAGLFYWGYNEIVAKIFGY